MKVLIDAQALFWWYGEPTELSKRASLTIQDSNNTILVSAVTAWELSIKTALGKLQALPLVVDLPSYLGEEGFLDLPISISQATRAGMLPMHHRDPFDRLLVAQAQELNLPILSSDDLLDRYDVHRIW